MGKDFGRAGALPHPPVEYQNHFLETTPSQHSQGCARKSGLPAGREAEVRPTDYQSPLALQGQIAIRNPLETTKILKNERKMKER